jgi:hypothetical protein
MQAAVVSCASAVASFDVVFALFPPEFGPELCAVTCSGSTTGTMCKY